MIGRSFFLFFIKPMISIWNLGKKTINFLRVLYSQILFKKDITFSEDSVLHDAYNVFRIILVCVLSKISIDELFLDKDSNFITEAISQLLLLIFYFILFQINFYYSKFLAFIKKDTLIIAIYMKIWQVYIFTFLFFMFFFSLWVDETHSGNFLSFEQTFDLLMYMYLGHFLYISVKQKKRLKVLLLLLIIIPILTSALFLNLIINALIK